MPQRLVCRTEWIVWNRPFCLLTQMSIRPLHLPGFLCHVSILGEVSPSRVSIRTVPGSFSASPGRMGLNMPLVLNTVASPAGAAASETGRESHTPNWLYEALSVPLNTFLSLFHKPAAGHDRIGGSLTSQPGSATFSSHFGPELHELRQTLLPLVLEQIKSFSKQSCTISCALK